MPPQLLIHYVPVAPSATSRTLTDSSTSAGQSWRQFLESFESRAEEVWWAWQEDNEDNVGVFALFSSPSAQQTWETAYPLTMLPTLLWPILAFDYDTFTSKRFTILLDDTNAASTLGEAMAANVTKVWTWWFPAPADPENATTAEGPGPVSDLSDEGHRKVSSSFPFFVSANTIDPSGIHGVIGGWRVEPDVIRGRAARSFTGFVGQRGSEEGVFRMAPPFEANVEGRIGMGMRTFGFGGHGLA